MQSTQTHPTVVVLSGSPSESSKTAILAGHVTSLIEERGFATQHIKVRDLPAEALFHCDFGNPELVEAMRTVELASGIVVATPTYKAAYSGLLKSFLDMLPQFGLAGKSVLPIATGGTLAHVLSLDYALRPVLQSMNARHVVQSCFVTESDLEIDGANIRVSGRTEALFDSAINGFCDSLRVCRQEAAE